MTSNMDSNETCSNCKYFLPHCDGKGKHLYGECRWGPPTPQLVPTHPRPQTFPLHYEIMTSFPQPSEADWCWKWESQYE